MENTNKLGIIFSVIDIYPKNLSIIDEAGEYIRSLKEDKALIINRGQSEEDNMRIQLGILYFLLTERSQTQFDFKDLILISRDGVKACSGHLITLISDNWNRLNTDVRANVLSILIDFISFPMAESLFMAIFKRMITGDLTQSNLWLIENMLNLIEEHKELLLKDRKLLPLIVYTYLRLIPTHYQFSIAMNTPNNNLARLCRKEIALVMEIIRNNFDECFKQAGRDLLFILTQVSNIPEFKSLWMEMYPSLEKLSNHFANIGEIFSIGTNKVIIATAIPYDMETWIIWTMRNVHHCSTNPYKRYQDLFNKRFFSTPESQNLRPFLIRYIIRAFYPDNEMIGSTLISRWATISWLIVQASSPTVVANCKLALIYDWLFYDSKFGLDCIMDIEPAILAIMHNLTKYSHVSITLVDFLVKTSNLYFPFVKDQIISCVRFGLSEAFRVSVFRSLVPLHDVLRHHSELHKQFLELIGETSGTCLPQIPVNNVIPKPADNNVLTTITQVSAPISNPEFSVQRERNGTPKTLSPINKEKTLEHLNKITVTNKVNNAPKSALFETKPVVDLTISDTEPIQTEDISFDDLKRRFMKYSLTFDYNVDRIDVPSTISQINSSVAPVLESLYETAENCRSLIVKSKGKKENKKSIKRGQKRMDTIDDSELSGGSDEENLQDLYDKMEQVVIAILNDDNFDDLGIAGRTAAVICEICYPFFDRKLFPDDPDEEKLKASLSSPVFVLFKNICSMSTQDNKRELLLLLLSEMQMRQPRVGYYLLYYLKVAYVADPDLSTYRSLCNSLEKPNLKNSLFKDLELLSNDDSKLMVYLLPDLYSAFSTEMVGSPKFAHLIISSLDAAEINELGLEIQKKNLVMFDSNSVVDILKDGLDWGTIEQYFLWELLLAHNISSKHFYGLIPYLDYKKHPEAILRFSNFLRQEKPNYDLIKLLLNRDVERGDQFTSTLLHFWSSESNSTTSKFVTILHTIISASLGNNMKDKKKNRHSQFTEEAGIDLIKILSHLDFMRLNCKNISFLQEESIQSDLQQVLNSKSMLDEIKSRFSELLAFVEEDDDDFSDEENVNEKNTSSGRVLRNSRRYPSDKKTFEESNYHKSSTAVKRHLYNSPDSSSSEDDSDTDVNTRKTHYSCRSKRRLMIAD